MVSRDGTGKPVHELHLLVKYTLSQVWGKLIIIFQTGEWKRQFMLKINDLLSFIPWLSFHRI